MLGEVIPLQRKGKASPSPTQAVCCLFCIPGSFLHFSPVFQTGVYSQPWEAGKARRGKIPGMSEMLGGSSVLGSCFFGLWSRCETIGTDSLQLVRSLIFPWHVDCAAPKFTWMRRGLKDAQPHPKGRNWCIDCTLVALLLFLLPVFILCFYFMFSLYVFIVPWLLPSL